MLIVELLEVIAFDSTIYATVEKIEIIFKKILKNLKNLHRKFLTKITFIY